MGGNRGAPELMADLTRLGIQVEAYGDRLRFYPRSAMTPDLIRQLRAHKATLLQILGNDLDDAVRQGNQLNDYDNLVHRGGQLAGQHSNAGGDELEDWVESHRPDGGLTWLHPDHPEALGWDDLPDPCPKCGSLELWESAASDLIGLAAGRWRCTRCDPPRRMRRPTPRVRRDPPHPEWPAALADFVLLLGPDDLPSSFSLGHGEAVMDSAKYLRWVQRDIKRGPMGPRARYGALQRDMERLRDTLLEAAQDE